MVSVKLGGMKYHFIYISYQRLKKMVLDAAWFNIQHYEVSIKGEVEQSRE